MADKHDNPFKFWEELKRRKVIRVITVYAASSFALLELVDIITEPFGLPAWTLRFVFVLLCIGFVISTILSWVYDITPEGVQKTKPVTKGQEVERPTTSNVWKAATYVSIVIIFGLLIFNVFSSKKTKENLSDLEKSIAVLPFDNMSLGDEFAHMGDAFTDEIILELQKIKEFDRVLSRSSTTQFKNDRPTIPEMAEKLGVNYLIEGSIQRHEKEVSIRVRVIRAINEDNVWADEYDGKWDDIFSIQDEIAMQVAKELKAVLSPEEMKKIVNDPTENPEAYDLYLKGRYFWNKRTETGIFEAIGYFSVAIEKDSTYALAWAGLADCYNMIATYAYDTSKDAVQNNFQKGRDAAIKALEIDSTLDEAYTSLALVKLYYDWDWRGAQKDFERAIDINPSYSTAHQWYANSFTVFNQHDKAITEALIARKLDPLSPIINRNVGFRYYLARKYDQAIEESLKGLKLNPDFYQTRRTLGLSYLQKGLFSDAISEMEMTARYSEDNIFIQAQLGYVYGVTGNQDKAQPILNSLIETSKERHVSPICHAIIYLGLGDNENAILWLEEAIDERKMDLIYLNTDPIYDPLRSDPRFIALIKKMGFPNSGIN